MIRRSIISGAAALMMRLSPIALFNNAFKLAFLSAARLKPRRAAILPLAAPLMLSVDCLDDVLERLR